MKSSCTVYNDHLEEIELIAINDVLLHEGANLKLVSANSEMKVKGAYGIKFIADMATGNLNPDDFDTMILPVCLIHFHLKMIKTFWLLYVNLILEKS